VEALLKSQLGLSEVELIKGHSGIFEVKVDGVVVSKKTWMGFPEDEDVLTAVAAVVKPS
jgi:predicted Rdx family selenoprotein